MRRQCLHSFKKYIFPRVSDAKLTEGIVNGPQIRELMKNDNFDQK